MNHRRATATLLLLAAVAGCAAVGGGPAGGGGGGGGGGSSGAGGSGGAAQGGGGYGGGGGDWHDCGNTLAVDFDPCESDWDCGRTIDTDCIGTYLICDAALGICDGQCRSDGDCVAVGAPPACNGTICVPCTDDSFCGPCQVCALEPFPPACVLAPPGDCASDRDCGGGLCAAQGDGSCVCQQGR